MTWKLFLDDVRDPIISGYVTVRSSVMAVVTVVQKGSLPEFMSLDHDLGIDDTSMIFLKELYQIWESKGSDPNSIPKYTVHSSNPVGVKNIISFMESWKKSAGLLGPKWMEKDNKNK